MRHVRLLLAAALIGGLVVIPAAAWAASPADVNGSWESVDRRDGSNQVMEVSVNPALRARVVLFDDFATVCGGGSVLARGNGSLAGDVITINFTNIKCENGTKVGPITVTYTYNAALNKLTDSDGTDWFRP